jgi:hypothetical protein
MSPFVCFMSGIDGCGVLFDIKPARIDQGRGAATLAICNALYEWLGGQSTDVRVSPYLKRFAFGFDSAHHAKSVSRARRRKGGGKRKVSVFGSVRAWSACCGVWQHRSWRGSEANVPLETQVCGPAPIGENIREPDPEGPR